jgi:hypothetical protein
MGLDYRELHCYGGPLGRGHYFFDPLSRQYVPQCKGKSADDNGSTAFVACVRLVQRDQRAHGKSCLECSCVPYYVAGQEAPGCDPLHWQRWPATPAPRPVVFGGCSKSVVGCSAHEKISGSETADHLRQWTAVRRTGLQGVHPDRPHDAPENLVYHPQSNGKLERGHRSLKSQYIRLSDRSGARLPTCRRSCRAHRCRSRTPNG